MIDREDLPLLKNILEIHNKNIDFSYLENILNALKNNKDYENKIFDSLSKNQFKEKIKLLELIDNLNILDVNSEVIIFGSWLGSIFIPILSPKVKKITAIDLDNNAIKIAKNHLFPDYTNVDYIISDIFSESRSRYITANLFINTSCEHMRLMKEWPYWDKVNKNSYFAFISNNMDSIDGHINCVYSLDEFQTQLPQNFTVIHRTEIVEERGTKYLLVGKISS